MVANAEVGTGCCFSGGSKCWWLRLFFWDILKQSSAQAGPGTLLNDPAGSCLSFTQHMTSRWPGCWLAMGVLVMGLQQAQRAGHPSGWRHRCHRPRWLVPEVSKPLISFLPVSEGGCQHLGDGFVGCFLLGLLTPGPVLGKGGGLEKAGPRELASCTCAPSSGPRAADREGLEADIDVSALTSRFRVFWALGPRHAWLCSSMREVCAILHGFFSFVGKAGCLLKVFL